MALVLFRHGRSRVPSRVADVEVAPANALAATTSTAAVVCGLSGLIGLQSGVVWAVSRCGPLHPMTLRYGLLSVFLPVAIVAPTWRWSTAHDGAA